MGVSRASAALTLCEFKPKPTPVSPHAANRRRKAVRLIAVAPVLRRLRQSPQQSQKRLRVPVSNLEVRPPTPVPLLHNRRPDQTDRRFSPRSAPKYVYISSNETVFTWRSSASIPRIFLTDAARPDPAGLRSERFASIIRPDKTAFLTWRSIVRSFLYLHRPAYRRRARAFGVHGERTVDYFG